MADDYENWDLFGSEHQAPDYIGVSRQDAEQRAAAEGVLAVRVADLDEESNPVFTLDYRPDRLNLLVRHGQVVGAAWG